MSNEKKPKWLKRLKRLMKSEEDADREALEAALDKLKSKSENLEDKIKVAESDVEREYLVEKLALVNKHREKGLKRLTGKD
jgi:hypothetical protein